jgi:hypothetical protein
MPLNEKKEVEGTSISRLAALGREKRELMGIDQASRCPLSRKIRVQGY